MSKPNWRWMINDIGSFARCSPRTALIALALSATSSPAAAVVAAAGPAVAAPASSPAQHPADEEMWLALRVNGQGPEETVLVRRRDGRLMMRGEDLEHWRLRLPNAAPLREDGESWYPLDTLPGLTFSIDAPRQALMLDVPPGLFDGTTLTGQENYLVPTLSPPGGFFNYDVQASDTAGQTSANALFELGAFSGSRSIVSTFMALDSEFGTSFNRLDTTWTQDHPDRRASLRLGDSITGTSPWSRSVRFGGIQWATNFATQPQLITYPQPRVAGEAVVPSAVDIYVNDALRQSRNVPAGPFSIQDLPVMTGQGNVSLVVRDPLGRESVIVTPYYASPNLLRAGLRDYSYELGFVRNNYGLDSNDYGRFAMVATHRIGFTDQVTGEAHGELLRDQQTFGLSSAMLWPAAGVFTASAAASHATDGQGALMGLGFQRQNSFLSFGGNVQLASDRFRQLGMGPIFRTLNADTIEQATGREAPRLTSQVFVSVATHGHGSFALSHTQQKFRDSGDDIELISANYSLSLGKLGYLSLSALRSLGTARQTSISLIFTRPLGEKTTASVGMQRQGGDQQVTTQVQRNLPAGSGYGYRLLASAGEPGRREADLSLQNSIGTYTVEAAQYQGQTGVRASASGGVALLGGAPFLSRNLDSSFAVVQVPDYPGVRVYEDNQVVAQTDSHGNALLPRVRPYQKNSIRIDQADLPMDAEIGADRLDAIPYARSGVTLRFPVKQSRGAVLTILLDNGRPLPAGAAVQVDDRPEEFPVGLRGEVYLTGLSASNRLLVTWHDQRCSLVALVPPGKAALPDLGTFTCVGVKP
jgi:outer membrane usher protein